MTYDSGPSEHMHLHQYDLLPQQLPYVVEQAFQL